MPDRSCLLQDLVDLGSEAVTTASEASCYTAAKTIPTHLVRKRPLHFLRLWLGHFRSSIKNSKPLCSSLRLVHLLVLLTGLISGWSTAAVVLFYDGSAPVNILHAVVILALIPLLLSLPFYVGLLLSPQYLRDLFKLLTPGRWALDLWRYCKARHHKHGRETGFTIPLPAGRHLAVWWTQLFSLTFALGCLFELFYQITIFDLAFAWSTTLNLSAEQFQQITDALSRPWSWLLPDAVPTAALIEASQYFRLQNNNIQPPGSAIMMTQWWPFLLASVTTYSLLPRLLSTTIAGWRLRRGLQQQILHSTAARRLLQLLDNEAISTRSQVTEVILPPIDDIDKLIPGVNQLPDSCGRAIVINWSNAADYAIDALKQFCQQKNLSVVGDFAAGGQIPLDQEQQIPAKAKALAGDLIWFRVKAWEPPLQEHQLFLHRLRKTLDSQIPLLVTLIDLPESNSNQDQVIWHQALHKLQDPQLYCHFIPGQLP